MCIQSDRKCEATYARGFELEPGVCSHAVAYHSMIPVLTLIVHYKCWRPWLTAVQLEAWSVTLSADTACVLAVPDDENLQNYIDAYLLKYTCGEPDCFGTMAPVKSTDRRQCNFCGSTRTEQEFLDELQAMQQ